jgi:streptomycin 6-kinase
LIVAVTSVFANRIESVFGERGREWLNDLQQLLDLCAERWSLEIGDPFELSYNYVAAAARADGSPVVLKAGVPNKELTSEVAALRAYDGRGAVRLLDADPELGVMLLERIAPGETLVSVTDDDDATRIAASVMQALKTPPPADAPFPTVAEWSRGMEGLRRHFGGGTGPFPTRLVEEAEAMWRDLLASQGPAVLLHGDLHHFNILRSSGFQPEPDSGKMPELQVDSGREPKLPSRPHHWIAIDPKGVIGEAEYEIGALLRNPDLNKLGEPGAVKLQKRRIEILAEQLGYDRVRLRSWAIAQAVLSACWTVEDHGDIEPHSIAMAERLAEIRF